MSDHLTPTDVTGRGFNHMPPLPSVYGGSIKAYESSLADGPHIWLNMKYPANLNEPEGEMLDGVWHGTAEDARRLGEQLIWLADNHYQLTPRTP